MTAPRAPGTSPAFDDAEGIEAVRIAREAIEFGLPRSGTRVRVPSVGRAPPTFDAPRGVFVTLREASSGELRGCIGYPLPLLPLRVALPQAALGAATEDPRFPPVKHSDLGALTIEVSLLTSPELLEAEEPRSVEGKIRIGIDGLIVEQGEATGLLLPQVAPEQGWDANRFLEGVCTKAGLRPTAWRETGTRLYRFQCAVFSEERPGGPVRRTLG
ncbi:MAG: TIGR00296 family protein [Thermoplasmata archaeon]|nr:TIGR00296 family protein [Thermoplasmata archaeon]